MHAKSKKTFLDIEKQIRKSWEINPRIRIQEDKTKNKKKRRQEEKRLATEE